MFQEEMKDFYERIVMGKEYYNGGQYEKDIDLGEGYGLEQKVFGEKSLDDMNDIEKGAKNIAKLFNVNSEGGISLYDKASPISTRLLKEYNLLLWPQYSQMYPLYKNIFRIFREVCDNTHHQYYTKVWLNYCHKWEYISDYTHWSQSKRA